MFWLKIKKRKKKTRNYFLYLILSGALRYPKSLLNVPNTDRDKKVVEWKDCLSAKSQTAIKYRLTYGQLTLL